MYTIYIFFIVTILNIMFWMFFYVWLNKLVIF